ncbi:MAG: GNAT family N-acetyltransferase [Pseudomonadota bacterium]
MNAIDNGCDSQSISTDKTGAAPARVLFTHVTTEREFDRLEATWTALFTNDPTAGVFNSWDWNRLWWSHYGATHRLLIVLVHVDGGPVAIAPCYLTQTRALRCLPVTTLRFIGSGGDTSPDDLGVLCHPHHRDTVTRALITHLLTLGTVDRLHLCDMPEAAELHTQLIAEAGEQSWTLCRRVQHKRRVDTLPDSVDAFVASLSKNARKQRKRRFQKLNQTGTARFTRCERAEDIGAFFERLATLHRSRQVSKGEHGSFSSAAYNAFHRALMQRALARGELRLVELKLDEETVGIEYAFHVKGVLALFQTGFDPRFKDLSPGHLMMMYMIERAIEDGATRIDSLKGDYDYKSTYAKDWQHSVTVDLYRSAPVARLIQLAERLRAVGRRAREADTRALHWPS